MLRYFKSALSEVLPEQRIVEIKKQSKFVIIDPDDETDNDESDIDEKKVERDSHLK